MSEQDWQEAYADLEALLECQGMGITWTTPLDKILPVLHHVKHVHAGGNADQMQADVQAADAWDNFTRLEEFFSLSPSWRYGVQLRIGAPSTAIADDIQAQAESLGWIVHPSLSGTQLELNWRQAKQEI